MSYNHLSIHWQSVLLNLVVKIQQLSEKQILFPQKYHKKSYFCFLLKYSVVPFALSKHTKVPHQQLVEHYLIFIVFKVLLYFKTPLLVLYHFEDDLVLCFVEFGNDGAALSSIILYLSFEFSL